jgi:DUF4097 and DUF4098 domain-containing protein YvlB
MQKGMRVVLAGLVALSILAITPVAFASGGKGREVIREGSCTGASDWKLKAKADNGRIEVEFEVDQNVSGDRWRVKIRHDGDLAFRGTRTTRGASGSFEVRIVENDTAGSDAFRARARNLSTDEVCVGSATF